MDPATRVKLALDESRMLILGAQVLLGFQLRSAFQDRFEQLSPHAKTIDAASLVLMVVVIGLLIAPPIHHRVVENGNATARILRAIGIIMPWALLPLALSLGFNVFIAMEGLAGTPGAFWSAFAATALALWFCFGLEGFAVWQQRGKPMQQINAEIPLPQKIDQMLTEARVILPGAQALLGFQLAVMLTMEFEKLQLSSKVAH